MLASEIVRLAGGLPSGTRQPVLTMLRQWQEARTQAGSMQRELDDVSAMAQAQQEQLQVEGREWRGGITRMVELQLELPLLPRLLRMSPLFSPIFITSVKCPQDAKRQLQASEEAQGKMVPQLEQLKWQARQSQKREDEQAPIQQELSKVWGRLHRMTL